MLSLRRAMDGGSARGRRMRMSGPKDDGDDITLRQAQVTWLRAARGTRYPVSC
jgi:hypothetical protein